MDFDQIADPQSRHPAWALLRATTAPLLDPLGQRDRYDQFTRNARELLDEMVTSRGSIAESDQGRSSTALFDFLLSPTGSRS
jgi:hypothetical protein